MINKRQVRMLNNLKTAELEGGERWRISRPSRVGEADPLLGGESLSVTKKLEGGKGNTH